MPLDEKELQGTEGIVATLNVIGGKWKPLILYILLYEGTKRFGELKRELPGITQSTLTSQLRELEKDGMLVRHVYKQVPPKVEYSLTDHAHTLASILSDLCNWGFQHLDFIERQQ